MKDKKIVLLLFTVMLIPISNKFCRNIGGILREGKVEVLSTVIIQQSLDSYKIVDALNRTLKHKDLMFGFAVYRED
jgi:hypothetical protein